MAAAKELQENLRCSFAVDTMTDESNFAYGALPERTAIILNGKVEFISGIGPMYYSIVTLEKALVSVLKTKLQ